MPPTLQEQLSEAQTELEYARWRVRQVQRDADRLDLDDGQRAAVRAWVGFYTAQADRWGARVAELRRRVMASQPMTVSTLTRGVLR